MKEAVERLRKLLRELKKPDIDLDEAIELLEESIKHFNQLNEELDDEISLLLSGEEDEA